jgi:hypothetical protein
VPNWAQENLPGAVSTRVAQMAYIAAGRTVVGSPCHSKFSSACAFRLIVTDDGMLHGFLFRLTQSVTLAVKRRSRWCEFGGASELSTAAPFGGLKVHEAGDAVDNSSSRYGPSCFVFFRLSPGTNRVTLVAKKRRKRVTIDGDEKSIAY